ncbi:hypothetical protein FIBSPDRAFT_1052869 [Athelia psychrophila]|uniref:DUF6697 domain-containing protein n=1 Tax=Athelia psychrophila TaxID=1759441 RepID=A0A165WI11_9AGAM|nr:hypothetical protein FIBSPDRAFT_1052869 [Fibularhizoctonia sp. CBS 109695]
MERRSDRINSKRLRRQLNGVNANYQSASAVGRPRRVLKVEVVISRLSSYQRLQYKLVPSVEQHTAIAKVEPRHFQVDIKVEYPSVCDVKAENRDRKIFPLKTELGLDVKPKCEDSKVTLSSQEVDRHLDGLTDFAITTGPLATPVKRKLLRTKYGVHPQRIVSPFINVAPPGKHLALCCTGELNPGLPVAPGGRGFLLSNRYNDMCTSEFSLFCRVFLNGRAYWRYYGEYRGSHTGFLSPLEFDMQSNKVKDKWAKKITKQKHPEYMAIRDTIQNLKVPNVDPVNKGDVMAALRSGVVHIGIVALQCFAYNQHLASDMNGPHH